MPTMPRHIPPRRVRARFRAAARALAILALSGGGKAGAHDCVPEKRWVDTLPDGRIQISRCLLDDQMQGCISATDTRPWTEDSMLNEILYQSSRRPMAALVRIDSVHSTHRDSAYEVDGQVFVERHMREVLWVTVLDDYRGNLSTRSMKLEPSWNMGVISKGTEFVSFWPGRGKTFLAFFEPGSELSGLAGAATECNEELSGWLVQDGRIRRAGDGAFPELSLPFARVESSLASASISLHREKQRKGRADFSGTMATTSGRSRDLLGREVGLEGKAAKRVSPSRERR